MYLTVNLCTRAVYRDACGPPYVATAAPHPLSTLTPSPSLARHFPPCRARAAAARGCGAQESGEAPECRAPRAALSAPRRP